MTAFRVAQGRTVLFLDTPPEPPLNKPNRLWQAGRHAGASRESRRRLPVVPLIADKRYYGESPASLRRGSRERRVEVEGIAARQDHEVGFMAA
jgi:hypothetical protein